MHPESTSEITNVYLFVSDALRYDYFDDIWTKSGETFRTVCASPLSCSAFASITTGLRPPEHGVWNFSDRIRTDRPVLHDLRDSVLNFRMVHAVADSLGGVDNLNSHEEFHSRLGSIDSPFLVFDRVLPTHAAYGYVKAPPPGTGIPDESDSFASTDEYWQRRAGDREAIRSDYESGVEIAQQLFEARMDVLEDRDLLDETLVVVTGDHGEVLGETGLYGHAPTLSPESVYVPTQFSDRGATARASELETEAGKRPLLSHLDYLPTFASLLDSELDPSGPGRDLTEPGVPSNRSLFTAKRNGPWKLFGLFDEHGGHAFSTMGPIDRLVFGLNLLVRTSAAPANRAEGIRAIRTAVSPDGTFGTPELDRAEARSICERVLAADGESLSTTLDPETREQLRALGYSEREL
jgi:hypothetical protein